jgi:predicted DNA-binding WGR domain protein
MPEKTQSVPLLNSGEYVVEKVVELNFFDLTGENAKTKNTSNKTYHAELCVSKTDDRAHIFTIWGPTGGHQTSDFRHYLNKDKARKEFESIIKSKKRKGYQEIDVAQRAYGSDEAKQITKSIILNNVDNNSGNQTVSNLHKETQRLISKLMGVTNEFVITTLKCPLGQLSVEHVEKGRSKLFAAKDIVNKHNNQAPTKGKDYDTLLSLTNDFYSLIPHNLGSGARGKMEHLLLNDVTKITQKEDDLDTLLDAKSIGAVLKAGTSVDDQYKALNTELDLIDHKDDLFKWIDTLVQETRASNHRHLGKIKVLNVWKTKRNSEYDNFISKAELIAKECGKQNIPDMLKKHVPLRNDIAKEIQEVYKKANVVPLFHGSASKNLTGILKQGLLIRPAGVVLTGSAYGNAVYHGYSTKAINYTSINSSYWAGGKDSIAYLFLDDCALGIQEIASGMKQYSEKNIKPNHSVWAKGGQSGVINDEFMLYNTNQHNMRYFIEFTCEK